MFYLTKIIGKYGQNSFSAVEQSILGQPPSDVHGQSARAMVKALIANKTPQEVLKFTSRRLKASREELIDALQGELTE